MKDLDKDKITNHKSAVYAWWNSDGTKKWASQTHQPEFESHLHYWVRQEKTLKFIDNLNLPANSKILELGYGGAQLAKKILDRNFVYYGIDISHYLCEEAKKNYHQQIENKKAFFYQGSLEEKLDFKDSFFDVVIICGAIHYAGKISENFLEVKRVLKSNGHYIIGHGNMFTLNANLNYRRFLKSLIWWYTNENYQHSYSLSFRDIILETRLRKFFAKYENSNFFSNKFMTKYSNKWKYKIHKRIFSFSSLKKTIESNNFEVIEFYGGPFLYSSENKKYKIKKFFNKIFQYLLDRKIFPFLIKVSDNFIFLSKPK